MKDGINRIHKILLLIIAGLAVILAALLVSKGYQYLQIRKQEKEWAVRHQEVQKEVDDVRLQIQELSGDTQALQAFLDEKVSTAVIVEEMQELPELPESETTQDTGSLEETMEAKALEDTSEAEDAYEEVVSSAIIIQEPEPKVEEVQESQEEPEIAVTYAGEAIIIEEPQRPKENEIVSGNAEIAGETVSGNAEIAGETVSGNAEIIGETVSGNTEVIGDTISGNAIVDGQMIPYRPVYVELTLEQRRKLRTSYEETLTVNKEDVEVINQNTYDFSGMKIACLGDSLTEGSNLDDLENYQQYSYPTVLKEIVGAAEVYNLGIGGSSYGRYWDKAFVDRYREIPQDADIIIVMGGTNDGFAASQKELGSLEAKTPRTFYGDIDELMRGLKNDYPNAKIIFATPLPNALHDYLRNEREYLLPQYVFANAIKELANLHQIDVIDLYNSNILDTHDAQIIAHYMPDGVHGNEDGYRILAQHMASEMIQIMEQDKLEEQEQMQQAQQQEQQTVNGINMLWVEMETVSDNSGGEEVSDEPIEEWHRRYETDITLEIPTYVGENKPSTYVEEIDEDYQYDGEAIVIQ